MSLLKQANDLFKSGKYSQAIQVYQKLQNTDEELGNLVQFNLDLIKNKSGLEPLPVLNEINQLPITVLVISWDVGHNPLGRAYMLAEVLERCVKNVVLTGFQFPYYGENVWFPVRESHLPVITLSADSMEDWLNSCRKAVEKFSPDLVVACKPRLPSVELGLLFKEKYGIPLIVDVDDYELSFFNDSSPVSINDVMALSNSEIRRYKQPYEAFYTYLADNLIKDYADGIIVSNNSLKQLYGGVVVPHVRDEIVFDPILFDRTKLRVKYGIPDASKVVMFFGTPRAHKGVAELASAVGTIPDKGVVLVLVGKNPNPNEALPLDKLAKGKVIHLPDQPFSLVPEIITMADLIVLPQDTENPVSKYQLPAKAIDAISMGVPLLVSNTEPLMQLVKDGVAKPLSNSKLADAISDELSKKQSELSALDLRKKFLLSYSYHAAATKLKEVVEFSLRSSRKPLTGFSRLKTKQNEVFGFPRSQKQKSGKDVVMFWKQNDTTLYGRRPDMIVKYLASRKDVRKILVFDAPISETEIDKLKNGHSLTHSKSLYVKTYEKLLGQLDISKVTYGVFTYDFDKLVNLKGGIALHDAYAEYLHNFLRHEDIKPNESIFWFYPKIEMAERIIDDFKPEKVIVDVVDDHRAWPNLTKQAKKNFTNHYKNLMLKADLAFANCQAVLDSMKEFKSEIELIPNGCEINPEIIEPKNHQMYDELRAFSGKVIGFVGNLEAKIDIPLIEDIANEFPEALLVLVGSTHANPKVRLLQRYKNIRMFGVIPYANINAVVNQFDVGIVPHKKMDLTDNMNPLKVFVYLANSIPVVASQIDNLPLSPCLLKSNNSSDFIKNIRTMMHNPPSKEVFSKFIEINSWEARFSHVNLIS